MNQLDAVLTAMAYREGRGLRTASLRHRRLLEHPMVLVLWQLGSEPFSASAMGFGQDPDDLNLVVAGDPRSRDLAFAALMKLAGWFLPRFEAPNHDRVILTRGNWQNEVAQTLPQIVVPNRATVELVGRLGRRLAYLPTTGDRPAPPELVRLGQHFQFLGRHAEQPGQQLIVPMGQLVADHWATPQTPFERASFAGLEAFVDPPRGMSGFEAAARAELLAIGPSPAGGDDEDLMPLVEVFNKTRDRRTEAGVVEPLLGRIKAHYEPLVRRTWALTWRALKRERGYTEAPSVGRRWDEDRIAYTRQMNWVAMDGRRRTRETTRQAIATMQRLEEERARVTAEEALDDPIRMIPFLLDGKAVEGRVVAVDPSYQEIANVKLVRRPLVTILSDAERALPNGKELWLTTDPDGTSWRVHEMRPAPGAGSLVTMKLQSGAKKTLPAVGASLCFSIHHFGWRPNKRLATEPPWPLRPSADAVPQSIEADGGAAA